VKQLGPKAIKDLVPYLNHDQWRWRFHSRELVKKMGTSASSELLSLIDYTKDDAQKAGLFAVMKEIKDPKYEQAALNTFKNGGKIAAGEAVQTLVASTDFKHFTTILEQMRTCQTAEKLDGIEKALLMCKGNKENESKVSKGLVSIIKKSRKIARRSNYYVLAMIGGEKNLDLLRKVTSSKSEEDFKNVVTAVSYSRDPKATKWLADIVVSNRGDKRAVVATNAAVKRMVLSENEIGHVDHMKAYKFAKQVLPVIRSPKILELLGRVTLPESAELMYKYMKMGPEDATRAASSGIVDLGKYMSLEAPVDDRKRVAELLGQVVEYLTVTHLRTNLEDVGKSNSKAYFESKDKVKRAGKYMLKLYDPDEEEVEDIDDDEIDI
jgi:hypothetical protein